MSLLDSLDYFKKQQLEANAQKHWDQFYKRNETRFFKDRHWTKQEFRQLCPEFAWDEPFTILEAGGGVGNLMFPLLEEFPLAHAFICDFSSRAIQMISSNEFFDAQRCTPFQCDLTKDRLIEKIAENSLDLCTLVFVLSAIHPDKMGQSLKNIFEVLKPGGSVLFRDYAENDHAMKRFSNRNCLGERFYVRQDGTRSYFFSKSETRNLFEQAGFETATLEIINKETVNRKEQLCVPRRFLQGRFKKPLS